MPSPVSIGHAVRHPRYGKGTVQALMDRGETARVYFELILLPRHVKVCELTPEGPSPADLMRTPPSVSPKVVEVVATAAATTPGVSPLLSVAPTLTLAGAIPVDEVGQTQARVIEIGKRLMVECLRQGLPPRGNISGWTVGFRNVRNLLGKAIAQATGENGTGSIYIMEAGYGQGKSHVGKWAQELALSQGLMTMHAELDGVAVTLSNGMALVARLFASTALPDAKGGGVFPVPGLGTVLKEAARRLRGQVPGALDLFSSFLAIADSWEGNEEALELLERYLSGDGKRLEIEEDIQGLLGKPRLKLPPLKVNWGRLEDRFKAQAQQLLRVVRLGMEAGAKGALIVLDEFDHEFWFSGGLSWRAQDFLDRMCEVADDAPVVLLLLTPSNTSLHVSGATSMELPRLDAAEYRQVFSQAVAAYRDAFPENSIAGGEDVLFQGLYEKYKKEYRDQGWGPRFFVRAAIEVCDRAASLEVPLSGVGV